MDPVFKPDVHRPQIGAAGFLKIIISVWTYVCMCVSTSEAINNQWHDVA